MTDSTFPLKNASYSFYVSLVSQADLTEFQVNPTIAVGDVKVSVDGGAYANITTLPVVTPAGSSSVKVSLSASEMNGDDVLVQFVDVAGGQWCDLMVEIRPMTASIAQQVWDFSTLHPIVTSYYSIDEAVFTIIKGDTMEVTITGLGNISDRSKFWFTTKADVNKEDTKAIVQIEETDGLLILNGETATTPTDGSITVNDAVSGVITIHLEPEVTTTFTRNRMYYDIQILTTTNVVYTLAMGTISVLSDITRRIT